MKKLPKLIFLCLTSLLTVGCNRNDSSMSNPVSSTPCSEKETTDNKETSTPEESFPIISSPDTGISSSEVSSEPEESSSSVVTGPQWKSSVKDLMLKHFEGQVVPFLDIGDYSAEWVDTALKSTTHLEITGDAFDSSKLDEFNTTLTADGYTITKDTSSELIAKKDKLTVTVSKGTDEGFLVSINYMETYNANHTFTAYDNDALADMDASLNNHRLPFVYLGSSTQYVTYDANIKMMKVFGFQFDTKIINDAKKAYSDAGWTSSENGGKFVFTKDFADDNTTLTSTFSVFNPASDDRYCFTVTVRETFNPNVATDWPNDFKKDCRYMCDGHVVDYFYLGTANPIYTTDEALHKITIEGGLYNPSNIALVKTTLAGKGYEVSETNGFYGKGVKATKTFDDGCSLVVLVEPPMSTSTTIEATVTFIPKLVLPSADKLVWPKDVADSMKKNLNGNVIPYVYLGSEDVTADYDHDYCTMEVKTKSTGTFSTPNIVTNAASVLKADGWTVTISGTNRFGDSIKAEKTFKDGDVIKIALESVSSDSRATLKIQFIEAYVANFNGNYSMDKTNPGEEDTTSTQHTIDENFEGHTLPYIYLGAKNLYSSYNDSNSTLTIYGGLWNENIIPEAKKKFVEDSTTTWTFVDNATTKDDLKTATEFTATATFEDGATMTATINKPEDGTTNFPYRAVKMKVAFKSAYGTTKTDWDAGTKAEFAKLGLPTTEKIPFFYLGSDDYYAQKSGGVTESENYVKVMGFDDFDKRIVRDFKTAFTAASYEIYEDTINDEPCASAIKLVKDASGKELGAIRAEVLYWDYMPNFFVSYDDFSQVKDSKQAVFTDAQKALMKSTLTNSDDAVLPSLTLGKTNTADVTNNSGTLHIQTPTAGNFIHNYFYLNQVKKELSASGYKVSKNIPCGWDSYWGFVPSATIEMTKTTAQGTFKAVIKSQGTKVVDDEDNFDQSYLTVDVTFTAASH